MNIYKISQKDKIGYDTFDSAIVVAKSRKEASKIHPESSLGNELEFIPFKEIHTNYTWTNDPEKVTVDYIGKAAKSFTKVAVITASFNAG